MVRPCFLVIDREYSGSISTRKLVIETAKLNVITAYSGQEALETLEAFPRISGIVLDAGIRDIPCCELVEKLRACSPTCPVIVVMTPGSRECPGAAHHLQSFDPVPLLALLQSLKPEAVAVIEKTNERLSREIP